MALDAAPIQTIRLSARDKEKLVAYIEQSSRKAVNIERRNLRIDFQGRNVLVTIINSHSQRVGHSVLPRNLSRWGLAFVHGRYVYPGSRCQIALPMQNGRWFSVGGNVGACRHVQGIIHEVSVVFDEALNLNDFVPLTAAQQEMHRMEIAMARDAESDLGLDATGRALVVDAGPTDRKLAGLWLGKLGMSTAEAGGVTTMREQMALAQFDLVLMNLELGEESGLELIAHLRAWGYERPIIAMSPRESPGLHDAAIKAGAATLLVKPFTPDDLRVVVEEALSIDTARTSEASAVYSSLAGDAEMLPLIEEFVAGLGPATMRLRRANADADHAALRLLCQALKGAGAGYGFESITAMARRAVAQLEAVPLDVERVRKSVNDLVQMLRRTRAGRPGVPGVPAAGDGVAKRVA